MKCAKCNNWITGLPCPDCGDLKKVVEPKAKVKKEIKGIFTKKLKK